jgi:hypothetical protein
MIQDRNAAKLLLLHNFQFLKGATLCETPIAGYLHNRLQACVALEIHQTERDRFHVWFYPTLLPFNPGSFISLLKLER